MVKLTVQFERPGSVCAYCGEAVLTGAERPEHPLPRALGSSLEIRSVCDPCNEWAGINVDQPFLADDWVRAHRALHDIRDPRRPRRRPTNPILQGTTKEGVRVVSDPDGQPRFIGRILDEHSDTPRIVAGLEEEAQRLFGRLQRRAAERGERVTIASQEKANVRPEVTAQVGLNFVHWGRMAAKIALGAGSFAYPEEWRTRADAAALRTQMRDPTLAQ